MSLLIGLQLRMESNSEYPIFNTIPYTLFDFHIAPCNVFPSPSSMMDVTRPLALVYSRRWNKPASIKLFSGLNPTAHCSHLIVVWAAPSVEGPHWPRGSLSFCPSILSSLQHRAISKSGISFGYSSWRASARLVRLHIIRFWFRSRRAYFPLSAMPIGRVCPGRLKVDVQTIRRPSAQR